MLHDFSKHMANSRVFNTKKTSEQDLCTNVVDDSSVLTGVWNKCFQIKHSPPLLTIKKLETLIFWFGCLAFVPVESALQISKNRHH